MESNINQKQQKPRAMTQDEVRDKVLKHLWAMVDYWAAAPGTPDVRDKISGAIFSALVMIDGEAASMPSFRLIPYPHPDDREYDVHRGQNYYPKDLDIAGRLHEKWHACDPENKPGG